MCLAFCAKQYTETRNKDTLVETLCEIMARKFASNSIESTVSHYRGRYFLS
jgi:hypothetical protein